MHIRTRGSQKKKRVTGAPGVWTLIIRSLNLVSCVFLMPFTFCFSINKLFFLGKKKIIAFLDIKPVVFYVPNCTVSRPRRQPSSWSSPWDTSLSSPRIVLKNIYCCFAWPFKADSLLYVPPGLTFSNSACWLHCVYVFCMALRTNSTFWLLHQNRLVFITEVESVYCAVRTGPYITHNLSSRMG
jgi:hypothetical protein